MTTPAPQKLKIILNDHESRDLLHRARTRLLSRHPFYGYLACKLRLREAYWQPTCATDGIHLFYNPLFVKFCNKTQLETVIAHEVEHVYLKHFMRSEGLVTDPNDQQQMAHMLIAGDLAINPHLKDGGFDMLDGVPLPDKKYWQDSMEMHFKRMQQECKSRSKDKEGEEQDGDGQDQQGKGSKGKNKSKGKGCKHTGNLSEPEDGEGSEGGADGQGSDGQPNLTSQGCSGVHRPKGKDGKGLTPAEKAQLEADLQTSIMNAASFAKAAGKLPADIERMIGDMRAPKISWREVLRRFMQAPAKNDYRMTPPNRRYVSQGIYLPSLRSETVGRVALFIDGSGSTFSVFPQFIAEFASILMDVRPEKLDVIVWDTRPSWWESYDGYSDETAENLAKIRYGAGGGSVFTEMFNWYEKEFGGQPQIAIVLTDMEIYFPEDPGYPVMWVATEDIQGPFGETVRIDIPYGS